MDGSQRLLVIEDDPAIARLLEVELIEAGYRVELAATGADGLAAMERSEPDTVILDVRLPDLDGLSVCRAARRSGHSMPILMLTALDGVGDRVIGLDAGADDYLAKPFAVEELLARLRALRAIQVLEQVGNAEARQLLKHLAQGAPDARETKVANGALQRLAERSATSP